MKIKITPLLLVFFISCAAIEGPTQPPKPTTESTQPMSPLDIKIGVLLPLSGSYQRYAESTLQGISCAVGLFDPCLRDPSEATLIVKDTKGKPEIASQAILELIEKERVQAIIGPLLSSEMQVATNFSQAKNVPFISLAPQKKESLNTPFLFQHSLIAEHEVEAIVKQTEKMGLKKYILLYPKNRYGEEYTQLFTQFLEEERAREKILITKAYDPNLPEFSGWLEQIFALSSVQRAFQKDPSKVGIFIPDSHRRILKMAEGLDRQKTKGFVLIGTSRWYHPEILKFPFASLQGALIDAPFNTNSTNFITSDFSQKFEKAFGSLPTWLEAIGYDATKLLLKTFQTKEEHSSQAVRDALEETKEFPATVGALSWNKEGISKWSLEFVRIQQDQFVSTESH